MRHIVDEANQGTHKNIPSKKDAEKIFLHICLFLDEIDWDNIHNDKLSVQ